jgi:hypothetical protein
VRCVRLGEALRQAHRDLDDCRRLLGHALQLAARVQHAHPGLVTRSHGTLAHRLIVDHLVDGRMEPGHEIGLRIDQTLTQDATGTLVMQELECGSAPEGHAAACSNLTSRHRKNRAPMSLPPHTARRTPSSPP